jgi:hypothetical protein
MGQTLSASIHSNYRFLACSVALVLTYQRLHHKLKPKGGRTRYTDYLFSKHEIDGKQPSRTSSGSHKDTTMHTPFAMSESKDQVMVTIRMLVELVLHVGDPFIRETCREANGRLLWPLDPELLVAEAKRLIREQMINTADLFSRPIYEAINAEKLNQAVTILIRHACYDRAGKLFAEELRRFSPKKLDVHVIEESGKETGFVQHEATTSDIFYVSQCYYELFHQHEIMAFWNLAIPMKSSVPGISPMSKTCF